MMSISEQEEIVSKLKCLKCKWAERHKEFATNRATISVIEIRCSLYQAWTTAVSKCPDFEEGDLE